MRDSVIPKHQEYVNAFVNIEDRIYRQVLGLISSKVLSTDPRSFAMAKTMFNTCINVKTIDGRGSGALVDVLLRLGGWPVLSGDAWTDTEWTVTKYLSKIRGEGFNMEYLFTMGVDRDPKNLNVSIIGVTLDYLNLSVERQRRLILYTCR